MKRPASGLEGPTEMREQQSASQTPLVRALAFAVPYWKKLGFVLGVSFASTLLSLAQPYFLKVIIDDAFIQGNFALLVWVSVGFFCVSLTSLVLGSYSSYRYVMVSARALFDIRLAVYAHLQRLSPRFYASHPMGDLLSRLNNDVSEIQRVASDTLLSVLTNSLMLVGTVSILCYLEPRLLLVSVLLTPLSLWVLRHFRTQVTANNLRVRQSSADIGNFLVESFLGLRHTVAANQQAGERERFAEKNDRFIDALSQRQLVNYLASGIPSALSSVSTLVVFLIGGYWVVQGQFTLGSFVAFTAYQTRLMGPMQGLMGLYVSLRSARASVDRVFELLDTRPAVTESGSPVAVPYSPAPWVFDRVRCDHGRGGPTLADLSLVLPARRVSAIVGVSGVGKSTIADLMLRRIDPDDGEIRLGDAPLTTLALGELRRQVAIVEQDTFLWNATVAENIGYACPEATASQIEQAARQAAIHEFIVSLPQGYLTPVGERGLQLSTGQRQRISVARALIQGAPTLVLDEATAALDAQAEASLLDKTLECFQESTVVILSHRLEVIMRASTVFVLDKGRVVAEGTPQSLVASDGPFARLFRQTETRPQSLAP